jgi:hypothetical protein
MIITTAILVSTAAAIEQQKNFSNQRTQTSSYSNFIAQTLY